MSEDEIKWENLEKLRDRLYNTNLNIYDGIEELGIIEEELPEDYISELLEDAHWCSHCGHWDPY